MALIKRAIKALVPSALHPTQYLRNLVRTRTALTVTAGPFRGMRYVSNSVGSALYPKLIGIYERELVPALERIAVLRLRVAIDIGAAEGYYAVGLLMSGMVERVIAYEESPLGRSLAAQMAQLNVVAERLDIRGRCEPGELSAALATCGSQPLVICDVEGYEKTLMDPDAVPGLRGAYILVELHEFAYRGITGVLRERFEATHRIEEILEQPRATSDLPFMTPYARLFPERYLWTVISEYRPERMSWLWLEPIA